MKTITQKLKWRLYGLKIAKFLLSILTLGIPTIVRLISENIQILEKKIDDEIKKEEDNNG